MPRPTFRRSLLFLLGSFALLLTACKDMGNPIDVKDKHQGKLVFVMSDTIGLDDWGRPVPGSAIFRMNLDGTALTRLTLRREILDTFQNRPRIRCSAGEPRWSRDGKKIIYSESLGPDESHIVMMNEDGSHKKALTPVGGWSRTQTPPIASSCPTVEEKNRELNLAQDESSAPQTRPTKTLWVSAGGGFPPFLIRLGVGVYTTSLRVIFLNGSSMFIPLALDANTLTAGVRFYESQENLSLYYSIEGGPAWAPAESWPKTYQLSGGYIGVQFGYDYASKLGFNASLSLRVGLISIKQRTPLLMPGIDLNVGWNF